jgi:hypothetical protein
MCQHQQSGAAQNFKSMLYKTGLYEKRWNMYQLLAGNAGLPVK